MLAFDVDKRLTTAEILSHRYFERVRDENSEKVIDHAPKFEFEDKKLAQDQLRTLICHEIAYYNDEWREKHFPKLEFDDEYEDEVDDQKTDDKEKDNDKTQANGTSVAAQNGTMNGNAHAQQPQPQAVAAK